jgi:hypothetical protein
LKSDSGPNRSGGPESGRRKADALSASAFLRLGLLDRDAAARQTRRESGPRIALSEMLLARLAMPVSDNAILRQLKRHVRERADLAPLGAIAIDDLERRTVADVLETRSAKETADWLAQRPEIEIVSRDRCGLYAQGIRQGAPQARQVADRFHLLQNLREAIERQMTAVCCFGGRSRLPPAPGDRQSVLRRRN